MTPLVASMQDQIDTLKQELEDWKEEARRKDAILMTMAQRIPELEASSEPRESPEKVSEHLYGTSSPQEAEESLRGHRERSWWRRFFGLE
jgi:seryl-tRNA synthetase